MDCIRGDHLRVYVIINSTDTLSNLIRYRTMPTLNLSGYNVHVTSYAHRLMLSFERGGSPEDNDREIKSVFSHL